MTNPDFAQIRRAERARIDRWFTADPAGTVFHASGDRTLWIRPTDAARWRDRGYAVVDATIDAMVDAAKIAGGLSVIVAVGLVIALSKNWFRPNGSEELIAMLVVGAWPCWITYRHYQALHELRAEIARSLAIGVPLPRDFRAATAGRNSFRTSLNVIVAVLFAALALTHVFPQILQQIPVAAFLAVVPLTWALHFAAQAVDRRS